MLGSALGKKLEGRPHRIFFVNLGGFSVENGIEKRASLSKKRIFTPNVSKRGKFLIVVYIF